MCIEKVVPDEQSGRACEGYDPEVCTGGTTYDEILASLPVPDEGPAGATFTGWQYYSYSSSIGSQKVYRNVDCSLRVFACYAGKTLVSSNVSWFGEQGGNTLDCNGGVWMDTAAAVAFMKKKRS
ncbi:MAG: hypothetical protein HFH85_14885 [Lachnospiraceae bacterium]|nr:hypothetical protein [Lachnospiraceae bacterium]